MLNRKGISPVVATSLLLVVAVLSVVGFMSWFETFQSSNLVDIESQSSSGKIYTSVDQFIGGTLYIKNGYTNLSINDILVDGISCGVNISSTDSLIKISLSGNSCINFTSSTPDFVVYTDEGVFSKKEYIKSASSTLVGGGGGSPPSLDCSTIPYGDWILVPGNLLYGTSDFCVMKYEAKWDGSGVINDSINMYCGNGNNYNVSTGCIDDTEGVVSQANSLPLRYVNQFEAIELCSRLGSNYHLITNNEWMTIARNIEQVSSNWADGIIGSTIASGGGLKRGNAGIDDSASYNGADPESGIGRDTKALLNLSNGEGIWDLSGNLWEWTSDSIDCSGGYPCVNMPYNTTPGTGWIELTNINTYGSLNYDLTRPSNLIWNSSYGVGKIYNHNYWAWPNNGIWNTTHAFVRGSNWVDDVDAGAFSLALNNGPSTSFAFIGFRCTYSP
jgi:flagellin-like protein